MTKNDAPAPVELPDKLRVHALAKLIGRSSREVVAALGDLGIEVKSAQSSIDRKAAEQVVTALARDGADATTVASETVVAEGATVAPGTAEPDEPVEADGVGEEMGTEAPGVPLSPIFAPPAPLFKPPERPGRRRRAGAEPDLADEEAVPAPAPVPVEEEVPAPRRRRRRGGEPAEAQPEADEAPEVGEAPAGPEAGPDDDEDAEATRRRRRRGRRGRGRGRGTDDDADELGTGPDDERAVAEDTADAEVDGEAEDEGEEADDSAEPGTRRRRRRRRRRDAGESDGDDENRSDDDPPGTVTRIRPPREARDADDDGVQSVRGSTRLEAKRQRRRDGRDAGRRRQPVLSEAEFLARRESVARTMVVRERASRVEIGVLEDDVLVEHFVAGRDGGSLVGNIYLGRVQNVLPSMEAAFVDIGRGRNAVLYAGEVDWDAAGLGGKARRIEQALSSGDSVLVQVTKDPIGHKGARLTTQISLAGRFLVYVPSGGAAGISRKLPDVERKRLKDMLKEIVPSEAGVIIRTASEGVSHEALERDVRRLQAQWEVVKGKADAGQNGGSGKPKAPVLLYEEPDLLIKVVRDQFNEDFSKLVVQGDDAWDTLHGYISHVAPELAERMHRHVGPSDVFEAYRIDEQLLKGLDRKVWLPSGGTLVIDRTEAMTVIDVNTGKFTGSGGNLEETVTRNNLEAAEEIVRQLRLRDIGGIIVIDFIDMVLEANRDLVLRRLTECLARDRTRHQVAEVTSLGLVQMTRKRVGGGLLEHFSHPCEHCRGRGVIVDVEEAVEVHDPGRPPIESSSGGRRSRGGRGRNGGAQNGIGTPAAGGNGHGGDATGREGRGRDVPATPLPAPALPRPPVPAPPAAPAAGRDAAAGTDVAAAAATPGTDRPATDTPSLADTGATAVGTDVAAAATDTGAPIPVAEPAVTVEPGSDAAADAVEEIVTERTLTAQVADTRAAAQPAADPAAANGVPAVPRPAAGADEATVGPAGGPRSAAGADEATDQRTGLDAAVGEAPGTGAEEAPGGAGPGSLTGADEATGPATAGTGPDEAAGWLTAAPASGTSADTGGDVAAAPAAEAPTPRQRRRGRVTRTAGAPSTVAGDAPVAAVVTVDAADAAPSPAPAVPPQPEPALVTRPRRARRAASRPAGPPVEGGGDPS